MDVGMSSGILDAMPQVGHHSASSCRTSPAGVLLLPRFQMAGRDVVSDLTPSGGSSRIFTSWSHAWLFSSGQVKQTSSIVGKGRAKCDADFRRFLLLAGL